MQAARASDLGNFRSSVSDHGHSPQSGWWVAVLQGGSGKGKCFGQHSMVCTMSPLTSEMVTGGRHKPRTS